MSNDPTTTTERPTAPLVAAVVSATDPRFVERCLASIREQVYGVHRVVVVGGDDEVRHVAGEFEAAWRPTLREAIQTIGPEFVFVWALREQAMPDPQALRVLVQDAVRTDASVAGSKIVDAEDTGELVSVGFATDVFGAPYSGLQPGEVDQSQYDVIRDVAAVSGVSVLIRRDLYLGLGGIDRSMASTAAAIDFCQRARLRGGRVVVVPGSRVRFDGDEQASDWRERAGEVRAMLKSYGPVTLTWALPLAFLIGVIEGVASIAVGRFPLPGVVAAWLWNLVRLPSTLRQRLQVRRGRSSGDEELFRYQVSGSARLRLLWDEIMVRMRDRFPDGVLSGFADAVEAGQQRVRHPAFFVGALVVLFGLVATREVWTDRLPLSGFSLLPPESATDTLGAFAGGWNPAGLGSPEALLPSIGAVAVVQLVTFGNGGLAVALITLASFLGGAFAFGRLLREWTIAAVPGYLAGTVLMAGPAIIAATGASHWVVIPAFAAVPPAIRSLLTGWRSQQRLRAGAQAVLLVGIVGVFVPGALLAPLIAVLVWAAVGVGPRRRSVIWSFGATALAVPLLMPWILYLDPVALIESGSPAYWEPGWGVVGLVAATAAAAMLAGDRLVSAVAAWGAALAAIGAMVARTGGLGSGTEPFLVGLILAGVGVAAIAGAGLEALVRRTAYAGSRRVGSSLAGVGAAALVVLTVLLAGPGRAGLPEDSLTGRFDFAASVEGPASRVLLFGDPADLPGSSRLLDGLGYRLFVPPYPTSWEARLNEERLGDEALHATLQALADGQIRRGGAALAEFGIGWVAFTEPSPLESVFESQLDLVALRSLDFPVFRNEAPATLAQSAVGNPWVPNGTGFVSPGDGSPRTVLVAANADFRWGPGEWEQADWANEVTTQGSSIGFAGHGPRRLAALGAMAWLLALAGVLVVFRVREGSQ